MKLEFKLVDVKSILNIRHQVLRQGQPLSSCHFKGDNLSSTFHYAAYKQDEIVGCISIMQNAHDDIKDNNAYQLRGMAVLEQYQGQKIGQQLLFHAEQHLVSKNIKLVWCNVRIKAIPFYSKNQYHQIGDEFNIPEVGPHVLMFKSLT